MRSNRKKGGRKIEKYHAEVIIIGGGIIGASIAYYCAKSGLDIILLEKEEIASGTSSRCDGNILAIDKDPGFDSQMSLMSQQLVHELSWELPLPFEYRNPGSILVCENDEEMEAAKQWVERQREAGLEFTMLDREDLRNESKYFADDLPGGLECKTDATVNPYMLTYSLCKGAEQFGARIFTHTEVTNITFKGKYQFIVETKRGLFTAKKVVNAGGVWAPNIGRMLDVDIPIFPRKGHLIVASRQQSVGLRKVMEFGYLMSKFGGDRQVSEEMKQYGIALVFEPTEHQNFLIGSSREFVGFDLKVNHRIIQLMAKRTLRFYPKIADMTVIRTYTGLRPWTEDHLPIISPVEEIPGFFIAAGHEGDGISLAAITGKLMEEMLNEKESSLPLQPLRYDRFRKKVVPK